MNKNDRLKVEKFICILIKTQEMLVTLSEQFMENQLSVRFQAEEWSPKEVLAHLLACQDVWGKTIVAMVKINDIELNSIHPNDWVKSQNYLNETYQSLLLKFQNRRIQFINLIKSLDDKSMISYAIINNRKITVFYQVRRMVKHEKNHWDQITQFQKKPM